jgi:hypothetical protein
MFVGCAFSVVAAADRLAILAHDFHVRADLVGDAALSAALSGPELPAGLLELLGLPAGTAHRGLTAFTGLALFAALAHRLALLARLPKAFTGLAEVPVAVLPGLTERLRAILPATLALLVLPGHALAVRTLVLLALAGLTARLAGLPHSGAALLRIGRAVVFIHGHGESPAGAAHRAPTLDTLPTLRNAPRSRTFGRFAPVRAEAAPKRFSTVLRRAAIPAARHHLIVSA